MENSFGSIVTSAKSILILLPQNPNLDEVAAGLSLSLGLSQETTVSCPTPMVVEFNRLIGVDRVRKDLGNKNLTIRFVNYKADDIEKVSYDIVGGEFRLTVSPKLGVNAPKQDQIQANYSGVSADLIVLVGGKSLQDFPSLDQQKELAEVKKVHFGTQAFDGANVIEFARPASAVSEVAAHLLKESGIMQNFDPDTATNILAGIEEGSKNFSHPYVNADTFSLLADLMKSGGRRSSVDRVRPENFPQGSIPGAVISKEKSANQPTMGADAQSPESVETENVPQSWFENPPVYRGTSTN